jgi:hypothetical protein
VIDEEEQVDGQRGFVFQKEIYFLFIFSFKQKRERESQKKRGRIRGL